MEREQAEREQRSPAADSWIMASSHQQLDESFLPNAFVNVGHFLNDQEQRNTAETSSQTPTTTTADANTGALPAPPMLPALSTNRRIIYGLLAFVVMLLGTNAYSHQQNRTWEAKNSTLQAKITKLENAPLKAENSALRAKIAKLEKAHTWSSGGSPDGSSTSPSCQGSQLIDTCWLKLGWGDCTEGVFEDPVKPLEDALRFAWDSTAEVFGAVSNTIASDVRQVSDAMHSFGRFLFEL